MFRDLKKGFSLRISSIYQRIFRRVSSPLIRGLKSFPFAFPCLSIVHVISSRAIISVLWAVQLCPAPWLFPGSGVSANRRGVAATAVCRSHFPAENCNSSTQIGGDGGGGGRWSTRLSLLAAVCLCHPQWPQVNEVICMQPRFAGGSRARRGFPGTGAREPD